MAGLVVKEPTTGCGVSSVDESNFGAAPFALSVDIMTVVNNIRFRSVLVINRE